MAGNIQYKALANDVGANVESQAQFELDLAPGGVLEDGFEAGTAPSAKCNKVWRQSSVMTAAIATAVSEVLGNIDMNDDGDVVALAARIKAAMLGSAWTTGDVKLTMKTVADTGWIMCNDGTIGSATSGATNADAANEALFKLLWNNVLDAWAPVVTGRGGSADLDWAANKRITLTKMLGRALAISGAGVGLTARALGQNLGEENHLLTTGEMPTHAHGVNDPTHIHTTVAGNPLNPSGAGPDFPHYEPGTPTSASGTGITLQNNGGGGTHNNMQPTGFLNAMIKR